MTAPPQDPSGLGGRAAPRRAGSHRPLWQSRTLRYSLIVISAVSCVLLFLLASASSNTPLFERHYPLLLGLNITITVAMVLLIAVLVRRLVRRARSGVFGTKLMARLALSFALMGVIPGALIYVVSVQFLSRSIESWFDVRVDNALESGLSLGRATIDSLLADMNAKGRAMVRELAGETLPQQSVHLSRLREQFGVTEVSLITGQGRTLAMAGTAGNLRGALIPEPPPDFVLRQLRVTGSYSAVESADEPLASGGVALDPAVAERNLRLRVVMTIPNNNFTLIPTETHYLQITQPVPSTLAEHAVAVQSGVRDYQQLSLSRSGLRKIYGVTLTLTLLLAVFAALAVAFLLATWLAAPLRFLAAGTKAVAVGDYRPMQELESKDELGMLTQSFNAMTRQLDEARATVERKHDELEHAKAYLESILANLSAGVLVFDHDFILVMANEGACRILGVEAEALMGRRLGALERFAGLEQSIVRAFAEQDASRATAGVDWQAQFELARVGGGDRVERDPLTLHARGSHCPVGQAQGYLVVIDDVSDVISAQRSMAWGEVARRLAHEIKNPLTPIQLSAERLMMKLSAKLASGDAAVLERGVTTIVNQVTAMKNMVDDFREYAKAPPAVLVEIDLNHLIEDIMRLYGSEGELITVKLDHDLPKIRGDATQLRQVIHNLVQNAQDAIQERAHDAPRAAILVATERIEAHQSNGSGHPMVKLVVQDNGGGFPARILARAFEPYVTTKERGTGLGLAMVKKIVDEHDARIDLRNVDGGACITILFAQTVKEAGEAAPVVQQRAA